MYLDHFKLKDLPFGLTPNLDFFCSLKGHQEALNVILFSLNSGEGFIKIVGEIGCGKTLLCRKLLNTLPDHYVTAYIPNPDLQPNELRRAFARELGISTVDLEDQHDLLSRINKSLLHYHEQGKRVVLVIDEAQALSFESLESLRLLTNLETEKHKLLQIVLFGQHELDVLINQPNLRQLKQRISFSYYLPRLSREDMDDYLIYRLNKAENNSGMMFNRKSRDLLYRASKGIPRIINILSHKALLIAYGRGELKITRRIMHEAIKDTDFAVSRLNYKAIFLIVTLSMIITSFIFFIKYKGFI